MRCYRKILHISYRDHVTNEEVRAKVQQAIGPQEDLLTIVKRRKLQWYGHVSRSSGLAKTILQGKVKEGRRQSRQRKSWEDNIREWTGLEFSKSQRAVENGENGRKLVAKSSVLPQRPSRLRDIWRNDDDENPPPLPLNANVSKATAKLEVVQPKTAQTYKTCIKQWYAYTYIVNFTLV